MHKKLKFSAMIGALLFINQAFALQLTSWAVVKLNNKIVTSNEVGEYIDHMLINESIHAHLFKTSEQNIESYQEKRQEIIRNTFLPTLKRIAFIRLAQEMAIQHSERKYFQLTKRDFNNQVQFKIKTALDAKGIDGIAEDLKTSGFPHNASESNDDIYKRWTKRLTFKMRESYRETEAIKYVCTLGDCDKSSPVKILKERKKYLAQNILELKITGDSKLKDHDALEWILSDEIDVDDTPDDEIRNAQSGEKEYLFIGKIVDQTIEFKVVNDWDITGVLEPYGYPDTDDLGRTDGLMLNYLLRGTKGTLAVELKNWLFTEEVAGAGDTIQQHVEEEAILRITSRQFLDTKGDRWVVIGISGNKRMQEAGFHTWAQSAFHTLNPKTHTKETTSRDGFDAFVEGIIGIGGKHSIIETAFVDIKISGEALLIPVIGNSDRNRITVTSAVDFNMHGQRRDYPFLYAGLFGEYSLLASGESETMYGAKAGIGIIIKKVYFQTSLYVIRWDGDLDRRYEGGASWTTGVSLTFTFINKPRVIEYEIN